MAARFLAHVRDSFFFLPADQYPVLDVGSTLNYEMYFYLLFALALMRQRLLAPLIAGAAVLAVIGLAARGCDHFLCTYYSNGYVKFFVFGIALYYPWATVAPLLWMLAVVVICLAIGIAAHLWVEKPLTRWMRSVPWRVPTALAAAPTPAGAIASPGDRSA